MTKGSYSIRDDKPPKKDVSFRSFITALLVFLLICLIIFLSTFRWNSVKSKQDGYQNDRQTGSGGSAAEVFNDTAKNNATKSDKIVIITVPETTHRTTQFRNPTRTTTKFSRPSTTRTTAPVTDIIRNITTTTTTTTEKSGTAPSTTQKSITSTEVDSNIIPVPPSNDTENTQNETRSTTLAEDNDKLKENTETTSEVVTRYSGNDTDRLALSTEFSRDSDDRIIFATSDDEIAGSYSTTKKIAIIDPGTTESSIDETSNTTEGSTEAEGSTMQISQNNFEKTPTSAVSTEMITLKNLEESTLPPTTTSHVENTDQYARTTENDRAEDAVQMGKTTLNEETTTVNYDQVIETKNEPTKKPIVTTIQQENGTETTTPVGEYTTVSHDEFRENTSTFSRTPTTIPPTSTTSQKPKSTTLLTFEKNQVPICRTSACNSAASRMLSLMNHSASPCEDFYEFACGGVGSAPGSGSVPQDQDEEFAESAFADITLSTHLNVADINNPSSLTEPKYLRAFKMYYQSCVHHEDFFKYKERIQFVQNQSEILGGFQTEENFTQYDITTLFINLLLRQSMPLFDIGLDIDKKSSNFTLQLTIPNESALRMGLENWSAFSLHKAKCLKELNRRIRDASQNLTAVYEWYTECTKNYQHYLDSIENVLKELDIFSYLNSSRYLEEIKEIRFTIEFEVLDGLNNLPPPNEIREMFVNKTYEIRKVSDLQTLYPVLQWKRLLGNLSGYDIPDDATVHVYFGNYFSQMFASLARVHTKKLRNALLSIYVHDLFINTVISKSTSNREEYCKKQTVKLFPDVTAYLMSLSYTDAKLTKIKQLTKELFNILKSKFCQSFSNAEWLDATSIARMQEKCNKIDVVLFSAPTESNLAIAYEYLELTSDYQMNWLKTIGHLRRLLWSNGGTKFREQVIFSYFLSPSDAAPLGFYSNQIIAVPLGVMNKIREDIPGYLVMADVGLSLAKEIARNFDPTGMFDWHISSSARQAYNNLRATTESLIDYSSPRMFGYQNITFKIKGSLSTNDRITENAAFRLVLDSFNSFGSGNMQVLPWIYSSYSREKIVFIAAAQSYCRKISLLEFMLGVFESDNLPAPLKVENIMGNSESFSEKFACPEGAGMNLIMDKVQFPFLSKADDYEEDMESDDLYRNK